MQRLTPHTVSRVARTCFCRLMSASSEGGNKHSEAKKGGNKNRERRNLSDMFQKALIENPQGHNVTKHTQKPLCRSIENDPTKHTMKNEGLFYKVEQQDVQRWMKEGLMQEFYKATEAFNETCIMVRRPTVEVMECMRGANYSFPNIRYVLYGRKGSGKSTSLAHLMHFCGKQGWMIIQIPWAAHIHRYAKDIVPSTFTPGRLDQPSEAAAILSHIRHVNEPIFTALQLQTEGSYTWSRREVTEAGSPLIDMIDFGLQRPKYASDILGALVKEIKLQSSAGKFCTLVAIDGVNAFWEESAYVTEENRHIRHQAQELSIVQHLIKLLQNDWSGGAAICTVDQNASREHWRAPTSYMPRFLLGTKGFELLDPFIPIHIPDYSDKEAHSCLDYFIDRQWIQNPMGFTEEGRKEIFFLSCKNPLELYNVTRRW